MYKKSSALFMLCETPLHAGSGDDLGMVDLPIQREKHTSYPKIEASSLKGALREAFEHSANSKSGTLANWDAPDTMVHRLFGVDDAYNKDKLKERFTYKDKDEDKDGSLRSGCLIFTDARILLFPVKTMRGVFVWVTCKAVLSRLATDMQTAKIDIPSLAPARVKSLPTLTEGNALVSSGKSLIDGSVVLEEFAFTASENAALREITTDIANIVFSGDALTYWKSLLPEYTVLLSDTDFRDFVNMSTEVITRTKIDDKTGTVADGALFTEEYLPTDSVMYAMVFASDEYGKQDNLKNAEEVMAHFTAEIRKIPVMQLGGNATIGKGMLRTAILKS